MPLRLHRPTRRQAALLLLALACLTLFSVLVPLQTVAYGTVLPLSFLLSAALCGAPLLMLTHPRLATAAATTAQLGLGLLVSPSLAQHAPWPWSVPSMLSFLFLICVATAVHGATTGALPLIVGLAAALSTVLALPQVISDAGAAAASTADLIVGASLAIGTYVITLLLAGRLRVGAELDRERALSAAEQERRLRVEERTRIARDLHDVIAHSMSVIQVQAATARYRVDDLSESAVQEFDGIAATARTSLAEMRRMLGVLRTEEGATEGSAELTPQRGVADIPALVDSIRRSGARVSLDQDLDGAEVPTAVDLAAFRIVQEALSNALRHAPGAPITAALQLDQRVLRVLVRNGSAEIDGRPPSGFVSTAPTVTRADPGHGLRGMRERAAMLGGTVQAAATADGGWLVDARLPLDSADAQEAP